MEQNWSMQPAFYNYYPTGGGDPMRPANDRPSAMTPPIDPNEDQHAVGGHRRSLTQPGNFLPPPPPHQQQQQSAHSGLNLPPFSTTFYGGQTYHSPHQQAGNIPQSPGQAGGMHLGSASMNYSSHMPMGPAGNYHYPMSSPANMTALPNTGRAPPPHGYSPRMTGYPSPGMRGTLSPTSPSTHMGYAGPSSASTSSSSFPPSIPPPHVSSALPGMSHSKKKRSSAGSLSSWDDKDGENEPWGMPQADYKALTPRDKKQVRNRIGARRFRAKRKDYVSGLESSIKVRDDELVLLRAKVSQHRSEINELRARLNMPPLTPFVATSSLGLVVPSEWDEGLKSPDDQKE